MRCSRSRRLASTAVAETAASDPHRRLPSRSRPRGPHRPESRPRAAQAEIAELRAILDTATDGVVVLDRDGRIAVGSTAAPRRCSATSTHEIGGRAVHRAVRAGERARRARLSRRADAERRRQRAQRRPRGDRPRAPGRADPAVHDHGPHRRRQPTSSAPCCATSRSGRSAEEDLIDAKRQRRARLVGEIRFPRQDQPRDPHAAQRHHRLLRGDDGGALRPDRQRALPRLPARTSTPRASTWSR